MSDYIGSCPHRLIGPPCPECEDKKNGIIRHDVLVSFNRNEPMPLEIDFFETEQTEQKVLKEYIEGLQAECAESMRLKVPTLAEIEAELRSLSIDKGLQELRFKSLLELRISPDITKLNPFSTNGPEAHVDTMRIKEKERIEWKKELHKRFGIKE